MSEEYKAKVFKSGNSLALRLPKALGLEEGAEMRVREEHGRFSFEPVDAPKRKIDLTGIAGSMPWLKPLPREDFDDSPRDWHLLGRDS
ncbi:AbrB/MazE/SpoVT family DNA-binding domain-containing protein [Sphingomonas sp. H39-1-10]|uniref:AbrB/MazE/SpoVT family DNA-binding domain-containing protein n=1 Tax=Sphingomonas TaxID=13687 RepID=UPI000881D827|nr:MULTISPECIES: AbrB/MazE/SpoVT family DNA-binding domain-containing protein [Sphingomonas]MDF0489357.1 AbrB/MazE/SpoVT family DNA-binding domain-containing protein [Sphingomonas pollutisoli]SDA29844.1 antitoxin VapB [Sphingomonas sp. NFR15]